MKRVGLQFFLEHTVDVIMLTSVLCWLTLKEENAKLGEWRIVGIGTISLGRLRWFGRININMTLIDNGD